MEGRCPAQAALAGGESIQELSMALDLGGLSGAGSDGADAAEGLGGLRVKEEAALPDTAVAALDHAEAGKQQGHPRWQHEERESRHPRADSKEAREPYRNLAERPHRLCNVCEKLPGVARVREKELA